MNFTTALSTCFQKFFTIQGRASRSEYWYFYLFYLVISIIVSMLTTLLLSIAPGLIDIINIAFFLGLGIPMLTAGIRRLHDTDRTGWWTLLALTIIGAIPLIYFLCVKGTEGPNRFGSDPLA